jgi:TP901 family phage tail tape measure protein
MKMSEWVLKISALNEKVLDKLSSSADKVSGKFSGLQDNLNGFQDKYGEITGQIPGVGSAMNLLVNPYVAAGAAIAGVTVGLYKATDAAKEYNNTFLDIKNLNLDKSEAELSQYSNTIKDLSLKNGFNLNNTAVAFYDVQSATGLYGKSVGDLVEKVGNFAIATKADFNTTINASTKAMKAFNFGVEDMDKYLASNAKTVQVGITTFKELAEVQTEYAGAAASANQNFDTANKIFAAFTSIAKDSRIAATMTKTAFAGFGEENTIKGLKSIGVNLFDAKGQMRSMDEVIKELIPKFSKMNDAEFNKLKNDIGGPEGLRNLMNLLKTSGDEVLRTFDAFDNSAFDAKKALANAKGDAKVMGGILKNQWENIMVRIGEKILPFVITGLQSASEYGQKIFDWFTKMWQRSELFRDVLMFSVNQLKLSYNLLKEFYLNIEAVFTGIGKLIDYVWRLLGGEGSLISRAFNWLDRFYTRAKGIFMNIVSIGKTAAELMRDILSGNFDNVGARFDLLKEKIKNIGKVPVEVKLEEQLSDAQSGSSATGAKDTKGGLNDTIKSGLTDISGGGKSVRNVTVNIQSLVKELNVHTTSVKEGSSEIKRLVEETILRAVQGAELGLA